MEQSGRVGERKWKLADGGAVVLRINIARFSARRSGISTAFIVRRTASSQRVVFKYRLDDPRLHRPGSVRDSPCGWRRDHGSEKIPNVMRESDQECCFE